ncbi:hypothetical protein [Gluconobacter frateurii]|uniref:Mu-like prophage FluMu N-terminal domain-containing protein n=1 Tax=Gluconobacter frateurii NRIC 0228 TaxID=1307946 RepID=A0ABQ0Q904_9PROT|nr:hypothetical protein [Gluconobacter frateurii]GBR09500.1 hypothetical protein AA0228_0694 [Gluconobacter frateurii NRIC 0228]GLP91943.1 hypothetical protein GCM10007868_30180 [Gluconobacter frateurii]
MTAKKSTPAAKSTDLPDEVLPPRPEDLPEQELLPPTPRVEFLSMRTSDLEPVSGQIIIVSRQPGLRRAGVVHPPVAVYADGHFSTDEMDALTKEPLLEVIEVL